MVCISTLKWLKKIEMHMLRSRFICSKRVYSGNNDQSGWMRSLIWVIYYDGRYHELVFQEIHTICAAPNYHAYVRNMTRALLLCSHSQNDVSMAAVH